MTTGPVLPPDRFAGAPGVLSTSGARLLAPPVCRAIADRAGRSRRWTRTQEGRWASGEGDLVLLLLQDEDGTSRHWCVDAPGAGRLALDDASASPPDDPRRMALTVTRIIADAVAASRAGRIRPWRVPSGVEMALRLLAHPLDPGAPATIEVDHPSAISEAAIDLRPDGRPSFRVDADHVATARVPSRPCRAVVLSAAKDGRTTVSLETPSTRIVLPRIDPLATLRLASDAARTADRRRAIGIAPNDAFG